MAASAQTCMTQQEMDPATRSAIENSASRFFSMAAAGDVFNLKQNSIPAIANDFGGIEKAVIDNKPGLSGGQPTLRAAYLLEAPGNTPIQRAEFFCGVFGKDGQTANSAGFMIPNLPPGTYAVTIQDVNGGKGQYTLGTILQMIGGAWKLAGFYAKPAAIGGHDGQWFLSRARQYKSSGKNHDAWFYYVQARELLAPFPFMSTLQLDRIYDEAQSVKPTDMPIDQPVQLNAGGKTYTLTQMFPVPVNDQINIVVKYQVPNISDTTQTFQDNMAVIKGVVTKYPELRDAFAGVVARAVEPSGRDYGSILPMKDIK